MRKPGYWKMILLLGTGLAFWGCTAPALPLTPAPATAPTFTAAPTLTAEPTATPETPQALIAAGNATPTSAYEIRAEDNGKTFYYGITSRFTVILDESKYPKKDLDCTPPGIIGSISNIPAVPPPLYAARFEGVQAGSCILKDGNFSVTIQITQ